MGGTKFVLFPFFFMMLCRNFICLTELIEEISNHYLCLCKGRKGRGRGEWGVGCGVWWWWCVGKCLMSKNTTELKQLNVKMSVDKRQHVHVSNTAELVGIFIVQY